MKGKVEAVLPRKKSSFFPADAMVMASSSASPAAIFAFLAPLLSLLRHVASLCAGYLGLDGGLKPSAPAPASSSSSAAAVASQRNEVEAAASVSTWILGSSREDCTSEVVLEVRSRGFTAPKPRSIVRESKAAEGGGAKH